MKATDLEERTCDVLILDAVTAFRIISGVDTTISVEANEFPDKGPVYVFQRPNEEDEADKQQAAYQKLLADWSGDESVPPLDELLGNELLVLGKLPFVLEVKEDKSVIMHLGRSIQEERYISIDETGKMYECADD